MKRRRGMTIVDVACLSGCLSLLLSLAVPTLQDAAQVARQRACQNNLRQIGIALHNYHDVYQSFGAGWYARYHEADSASWVGFQSRLLPYMDQRSLYEELFGRRDPGRQTEPEWPDSPNSRTELPPFHCPADTTGPVNVLRGGFSTSNYSGNGGSKPFSHWYSGDAERYWPGGLKASHPQNDREAIRDSLDGFFSVNSNVGIRDVTDGTSNTILVTERSARSGAGLWLGVRSNRDENDVITEFSHLSRPGRSWTSASSFHGLGINVLLGDGSVRNISNDISSSADGTGILQLLAARNDGRPLTGF